MSGFGRAMAAAGGRRAVAEIKTTNHRHLDLSLSLPDALASGEAALRARLAARFHRGRVEARVTLEGATAGGRFVVDRETARRAGSALKAVARELGLAAPSADVLLHVPGVLRREEAGTAGAALSLARRVLDGAAARALAMREREGRALARDLVLRLGRIEAGVSWLAGAWPSALARQRDRNLARVRELLERAAEGKSAALAKELAALADRGDATEELVRLGSHLAQARAALQGGEPCGRRLEFLVQEIGRELNTTGAKADGAEAVHKVIALKEEAERIREQVLNLE